MSDSALSIGLFYGSTTCYTEMAAEKIQAQLNSLFDEDIVDLHNIKDVNLTRTAEYDIIIFGISTWDFGELQEGAHHGLLLDAALELLLRVAEHA